MRYATARQILCATFSLSIALMAVDADAQSRKPIDSEKARVVEHWTKERRAAAIPRDLVIDERGLGYLRRPDKTLVPYGHDIAAQEGPRAATPSPFAKPGGGGTDDTLPPEISAMDPGSNAQIGASYTFSATVTDASGVKSVTFRVQKSGGLTQSFSAAPGANNVWSASLSGFTDGSWSWWVDAKDNAGRGGNSGSKGPIDFTVKTGGGGTPGGGSDTIKNSEWTAGGKVQNAAGRIYFEMPNNAKRKGPWSGYVCSGTVVTDNATQRSVIITAAHCVYDDSNKAFARNVLFIPNQAATTASGTNLTCGDDPMGCWTPSFGVVHKKWTLATFPNNVEWDYAFYVVKDSGSHGQGYLSDIPAALDEATGSFPVLFTAPSTTASFEYALGYSYSDDPKFMYCAQNMTTAPDSNVNWWLADCGLSGGSSGGLWVQPGTSTSPWNGDDGSIISVNSWGYTNQPGMAGPKLVGNSAVCVFNKATSADFSSIVAGEGNAGIAEPCP